MEKKQLLNNSKNKIMKLLCSGVLISVLFCACSAQQNKTGTAIKNPDNNTLLWQISGKDLKKPSYLFGTFHLLCKDDIHFSAQLKSALQSSDEIYMELDMDDPSTIMSGLLYMNMKGDKKLKDLYSPAEYKKIEGYFNDSLHTPLLMLQSMKPYFLVAMLYPKMMNCKNASGVEEELMQLAKENKKEIQGLETMQFQASVFDSIPYEWQAKELMKNIDSFASYKKEFDTMVDQYKSQQLNEMGSALAKSEFGSDSKYEGLLLNDRNKNWVQQLKKIMARESVFVAVGAGHLVGEKGLISLLRKEGYIVDPLLNK